MSLSKQQARVTAWIAETLGPKTKQGAKDSAGVSDYRAPGICPDCDGVGHGLDGEDCTRCDGTGKL